MVPFCGWSMPVQYKESIGASHKHCREKACLFDVSHMGQLRLYGADRGKFLERWVVGDVQGLKTSEGRLSLITNAHGGIKDDTIITAQEKFLSMVVNAGCFDKDYEHLKSCIETDKANGLDISMEHMSDLALIALQGPSAMEVLKSFVPQIDLVRMPFMHGIMTSIGGVEGCTVTRCGYTGEDGFELSIPSSSVDEIARKLVEHADVLPCGLGARDSLRLEAGLCLYGNDIDEDTTPVEAALLWTIPKHRRVEGGFNGSDVICQQIKDGAKRKRIGLAVTGGIAREGSTIINPESGETCGNVTSGTQGPTLGKPVAMGYVETPLSKVGTALKIDVKGRLRDAVVVKMPFVPNNFYRMPA